jgi:hypothetical protein
VVAFAKLTGTRRTDSTGQGSATLKLPKGAEAALWSIVEPLPDPRNHLALTRDLSGEVRITDFDRAVAAEAFGVEMDNPALVLESRPVIDVRDKIDLRDTVDNHYDLGAIAENASLTNHLFADRPTP